MKAVVVRAQNEVGFDDVAAPGPCGETDVRVRINTVGICGSDIHCVTHGRIGSYVIRAPMVLGHEASGVVTEVGTAVRHLSVGDRVCMEPGIPNPSPAPRGWASTMSIPTWCSGRRRRSTVAC